MKQFHIYKEQLTLLPLAGGWLAPLYLKNQEFWKCSNVKKLKFCLTLGPNLWPFFDNSIFVFLKNT